MSRHRMTQRKKAFADALVLQQCTATEAARRAGYKHPQVKASQMLQKDNGGNYVDKALGAYLRELYEAAPKLVTLDKGQVGQGATAEVDADAIGTAEEVIEQLFAMLRDKNETGGTRIRAAETLLKALGADRPAEARERDAENAANAIRQLLGITG